ncbi:MAG TPA: GNAT family N-acetyltransferase [Acidimicrobiales bacterium]|nr:GNAT family N-acetyltransferase [Acidimicrobiales bacterium]
MPATIRRLEKGEELAFVRSVRVPFLDPSTGDPEDDAADGRRAGRIETERAWVVEDAGRFVGNSGVRTMDLTVPSAPGKACPIVRMGGVTAVGVHPTHRRRGFLGQMMTRMLDDCTSHGEPFAGLLASESAIYGRYGFGLASDSAEYAVDAVRSAFTRPAPQLALHLVDKDEARKLLPDIWERNRRTRPGEPNRTSEFWDEYLQDKPAARHGASGLFFAACDDGYASYRAKSDDDVLRGDRVGITVEELCGADCDVEAALWRFVLDLDLVGTVTFRRRPVDEPVRWRLRDPRQLQTIHVDDRIYIRILDVPASLTQRGYEAEGRLVLDVQPADVGADHDPAVGTWVLEAGTDGADCTPAGGAQPDLRMRVSDLGSLYLGGFKASTLAAAGLIEELTAGSLASADRLFASRPAPLTVTGF